jgi:hypothetical protein
MRSYDVDRYAGMTECAFTPAQNERIRRARRSRASWDSLFNSGAKRFEAVPVAAPRPQSSGLDLTRSHMEIASDLMRRPYLEGNK